MLRLYGTASDAGASLLHNKAKAVTPSERSERAIFINKATAIHNRERQRATQQSYGINSERAKRARKFFLFKLTFRQAAKPSRFNGSTVDRCADSFGASRIFLDRPSWFGVTRFFSPARKSGKPRLLQIFLTRSSPCRRFDFNGWGGFAIANFSDFGFAGFRGLGVAV